MGARTYLPYHETKNKLANEMKNYFVDKITIIGTEIWNKTFEKFVTTFLLSFYNKSLSYF